MHTGLPAAPLRKTPSAIRDDRLTRCPFPAATNDAPVAPVRSQNTAMEHQNCCTDLRHPELLAACCPYSSVHGKLPSRTKKVGKLPPLRSFSFLTLRVREPGNFGIFWDQNGPSSPVRIYRGFNPMASNCWLHSAGASRSRSTPMAFFDDSQPDREARAMTIASWQ